MIAILDSWLSLFSYARRCPWSLLRFSHQLGVDPNSYVEQQGKTGLIHRSFADSP